MIILLIHQIKFSFIFLAQFQYFDFKFVTSSHLLIEIKNFINWKLYAFNHWMY
jgi:hypothetical protein